MEYQLKADFNADWITVPKEEWVRAERSAGFRPKMASDHPDYHTTCATGGFGNGYIHGRILND